MIIILKNETKVFQNANENEITEKLMEFINEVNTKIETYVENGLDIRFEEDETAYANVSRYDPLVAGTYMPLPKTLKEKKSNHQCANRRDNEYLKWSLRAVLFPAPKGKNPLRTTSYPTDDECP